MGVVVDPVLSALARQMAGKAPSQLKSRPGIIVEEGVSAGSNLVILPGSPSAVECVVLAHVTVLSGNRVLVMHTGAGARYVLGKL